MPSKLDYFAISATCLKNACTSSNKDFFPIFENIPKKPTKFPFQRRIARLCSVYIVKMAAVFIKSIQIFSGHPVHSTNQNSPESCYYSATKRI